MKNKNKKMLHAFASESSYTLPLHSAMRLFVCTPLFSHQPSRCLLRAGVVFSLTPLNSWPSQTSRGSRTRTLSVWESFHHTDRHEPAHLSPTEPGVKGRGRTCVVSHTRNTPHAAPLPWRTGPNSMVYTGLGVILCLFAFYLFRRGKSA